MLPVEKSRLLKPEELDDILSRHFQIPDGELGINGYYPGDDITIEYLQDQLKTYDPLRHMTAKLRTENICVPLLSVHVLSVLYNRFKSRTTQNDQKTDLKAMIKIVTSLEEQLKDATITKRYDNPLRLGFKTDEDITVIFLNSGGITMPPEDKSPLADLIRAYSLLSVQNDDEAACVLERLVNQTYSMPLNLIVYFFCGKRLHSLG